MTKEDGVAYNVRIAGNAPRSEKEPFFNLNISDLQWFSIFHCQAEK